MDEAVKKLTSEVAGLKAGAGNIDPIAELGINLEQQRYEARYTALTDPATYKANRDTAFDALKRAVSLSYHTAHRAFISAWHPAESAKQMALAAAEGERRVQSAILESQFTASANDIGMASASARSAAFAGHISGATSRAAHPAVRRKRAKKRATTRRKR